LQDPRIDKSPLLTPSHRTENERELAISRFFSGLLELGAELADCDYVIEDGYASLPQKPGLGVEMNEEVLRSLAP
jgi:L-alanine-DL-glutamate epimerase-like enolase superfamily enzyme